MALYLKKKRDKIVSSRWKKL